MGEPTDFVKLAEALGAPGYRVKTPDELDGTMQKAFAHKEGPVLVACDIHMDENVMPMVPTGQSLDDIILAIDRD